MLDLTDEMLAVGKREADAAGVRNVVFQQGRADAMPFLERSFDLVVSRFAVHHFDRPQAVLTEMARVCRADGRVGIMDIVVPEVEHVDAYNRWHAGRRRATHRRRSLRGSARTSKPSSTGLGFATMPNIFRADFEDGEKPAGLRSKAGADRL